MLLKTVGLAPELMKEYPHTLAAGQKQCVGIARSIALGPKFVVADEPISALDVSVRAMVLNLLKDLQESQNLTYMFISHDIRVVRWLSSHIAVMYLGQIVEYAPTEEIFQNRLPKSTLLFHQDTPGNHLSTAGHFIFHVLTSSTP